MDNPPTSSPGATPPGMWMPPPLEVMQAMLPHYRFECFLGRGGMGAVYQAVQISLDRVVAIKVLPGDLIDDGEANFVERFKNEARTMAKMNHPGIVNVYDFGETQTGLLYFAMEYIDGTDVAKIISANGRLSQEQALAITAHVCDALHYAHMHGVLHRDIKPANVLISMEGQVKVADFGLAKASDQGTCGLTRTNMVMGTPDYLAPEALIDSASLDGRADLYAVGVMLYTMLTGKVPRGMWMMPSEMIETDPRFDEIIGRAMQANPDDRHQSAMDLRCELDVILTVPNAQQEDGDASAAIPKQQLALIIPRQAVVPHRGAPRPGQLAQRQPQRVVTYVERRGPLPAILIVALLAAVGFFGWRKFGKPVPDSVPAPVSASVSEPLPVLQSSVASTPLTTALTALPTTGWQAINIPLSGRVTSLADGWKNLGDSYQPVMQARDLAVRVKLRLKKDNDFPLRFRESPVTGHSRYAVVINRIEGKADLMRRAEANGAGYPSNTTSLGTAKLPRAWTDKDEFELAFVAQGEQLSVFFDGKLIIQNKDIFCPGDGFSVGGAEVDVKDLQWMPLSPAPGSMRVVEMPQGSMPEGWADALALVKPETHAERSTWERTSDGLKWVTNEQLPQHGGTFQLPVTVGGRYAVAMEFTPAKTTGSVAIILPLGGGNTTACLFAEAGFAGVANESSAPNASPFKLEAGRRYRAQASVQPVSEGVDIQFYVDDKRVGSYRGPVSQQMGSSMWLQPSDHTSVRLGANMPVTFHRAAVWSLPDVAPSALSSPAAATTALPAQTFEGHKYQIVEAKGISLKDAKAQAESMGGNLVSITSSAENDFLMTMCQPVLASSNSLQLWTAGLRTSSGTNGWTWTTGEPFNFADPPTNWQSSTEVGDALTIMGGSRPSWNDFEHPETTSRGFIHGFMVEWDGDAAPTQALPPDSLAFGGHRYLLVRGDIPWDKAKVQAEQMGGHLATITSAEEDEWVRATFIESLPDEKILHIGGQRLSDSESWAWVTGEPWSYTRWRKSATKSPGWIGYMKAIAENELGWNNWGMKAAPVAQSGPLKGLSRVEGFLVEWDQDTAPALAPSNAPLADTINLLTGVDVKRDAVLGTWELKPDGLVAPQPTDHQVLEFNQVASEEYDFEIEFTVSSGTREVAQILPLPGHAIVWHMCPFKGEPASYRFGPLLDGVPTTGGQETSANLPRLKIGQRYRSLVEVRKDSLRAVLDGQEIVKWSGDLARFTINGGIWALRNPQHLGLVAISSDVTFHKAELRIRGFVSERLAQIKAQFNEAHERDVTQSAVGKAIADLDTMYLAAIDRAIADATKAAKLNDVTALNDEKKRVADHAPLPATDPVNIVASLGKLRVTYRKSVTPLIKQREALAAPVYARYDQALAAFEAELTQKNALGDARQVRAKRDELDLLRHPEMASLAATSVSPAPAAAEPTTSSSALSELVLKETPPKPFTPDEAIRWALSLNGSATILRGREESEVMGTANMPKGRYVLIGLKVGEKQLQQVVTLAGLANLSELRELVLDNNLLTDAGLAFLPRLPKLAKLGLHDCGLSDMGLAHLAKQPALTELDVGYNRISGTGLGFLDTRSSLKSLAIGSSSLTDEGMAHIARCTSLTALDLSSIGASKVTSLSPLAGIGTLRELRLLQNTTDTLAQSLATVTQITSLDLTYSPISDMALDPIRSMTSLRDLNLYGCGNLTDAGYHKLLPLGKSLTRLNAAHTRLGDPAFSALCDNLTELGDIDISHTAVSSTGLEGLAKLKKLRSLIVHAQQCDDEGLRILSRITGDPKLETFGLREFEKLDEKRQEAVRNSLTRWNF